MGVVLSTTLTDWYMAIHPTSCDIVCVSVSVCVCLCVCVCVCVCVYGLCTVFTDSYKAETMQPRCVAVWWEERERECVCVCVCVCLCVCVCVRFLHPPNTLSLT